MAQTNIDANRVIQSLSAQLAQANLQNTILQLELSDAQAVIAKHKMASDETPASDGA